MAVVSTRIPHPPEQVFAVLRDGYSYADWVVGATAILSVGKRWPEVGWLIHYRIGLGPFDVLDHTMVYAVEENRLLELRARMRPMGTARILFTLEPVPGGNGAAATNATEVTDVTVNEHPASGLGALLHNRLLDALLVRRNTEMLRRFSAVVADRARRS